MYILINKTFLTIPYKFPDPFVLCDLALIEFPEDEVDVIGIDSPHLFEDYSTEQIREIYLAAHNMLGTELPRSDLVKGIVTYLEDCDISRLNKFYIEAQARSFNVDKTDRHRYVPNSALADKTPVKVPNLSFVQISKRHAATRHDEDSRFTCAFPPASPSHMPQFSRSDFSMYDDKDNDLINWYMEKFDPVNISNNSIQDEIRKYLVNQRIPPWSVGVMIETLKKRLTNV